MQISFTFLFGQKQSLEPQRWTAFVVVSAGSWLVGLPAISDPLKDHCNIIKALNTCWLAAPKRKSTRGTVRTERAGGTGVDSKPTDPKWQSGVQTLQSNYQPPSWPNFVIEFCWGQSEKPDVKFPAQQIQL